MRMKKKESYPNIVALRKRLKAESPNFQKQLMAVRKKYPLIAVAYSLQKAMISDLSIKKKTSPTEMEILHAVLTDTKRADPVGSFLVRMRQFNNCLSNVGMDIISVDECIERYLE